MRVELCNIMGNPAHFPIAKITPPRVGVPLLSRNRLHDAVRTGVEKKLLLLSAEAGYGKTTLLVAALPELELPVAWLTVDAADSDANLFSAALAASVHRVLPDKEALVEELLTVGPSQADLRRILLRMLDELPPLVIVLDDFHAVDDSPDVVALVDHLLRNAPPAAHFAIATRTWPALTILPRLLVAGDTIAIDMDRLRFTEEEAAAFLRTSHGLEVDDVLAEGLIKRTEGWAAALQLAALASKTRGTPALVGTPREVFDYLATSVVDALEPGLSRFLQATSFLNEFWPDLCAAVAPEANVPLLLNDIERRNLFLYRLDDVGPRYRYHQLFAEFLQQRLAAQDPDEVLVLHQRAARFLEKAAVPDEAVRHYLAAGAFTDAERVMRPLHGDRLTARLAYTFRDLVTRLPSDVLDQFPWITRCGASACRYVGDYVGGLALAERASAAADGHDPNLWAFSRHGMAVMLLCMDRYEEASAFSRDALARLDPGVESRWRIALLTILADSLLQLGRLNDAEALLPEIEGNAPVPLPAKGLREAYFRAALALARMEFTLAATRYEAALAEARIVSSLTYETAILIDLVAVELARRNPTAARAALERARTAHQQTGERLADLQLTLFAGSVALLERDLEEAAHQFQRVLEQSRETETQEPRILALLGLAQVARARGAMPEAETLLRTPVSICERIGLGKLLPQLRLEQISLLVELGELEAARRFLPELREVFKVWGTKPGLARALLWQAQLFPAAEDGLGETLTLAAGVRDDLASFLLDESRWVAPLFLEAIRRGVRPRAAEDLLTAMGSSAVDTLIAALKDFDLQPAVIALLGAIGDPRARRPLLRLGRSSPRVRTLSTRAVEKLRLPEPVTLRVRLLGTFEVLRSGEQIPSTAWKTQKVRSLFKFLLLHRHRAVPQDEIIDALWPDASPTAGATNLKTAVKTLRQALEPLLEGAHSTFISRGEQTLQFTPRGRCILDVDEYDLLVADARRHEAAGNISEAISTLEAAVSLYRADLLDEDRYEDWAAMERERRRETQIEVLESLALLHAKRRDYRRAIAAVQQVLALDRLRETAYRDLMRYSLARGDRQTAIRAYETCERLLREELGVGPQPETAALYEHARATASV